MKIIKIAQRNIELPANRMPRSNTYYIRSTRLTKTTGGSNKEYIVRIYMYDNVTYSVVCWNGRIDGTLTPQPKYYGTSLSRAESIASDWVARKRATGYREVVDNDRAPGTSMRPTNFPALGRPSPIQQSTTPTPEPSTPSLAQLIDYDSLPPEIQFFVREMVSNNEATLGRYFYRIINRVDSRRGSTWLLEESRADNHGDIIRDNDRFTNLADAIRVAARWAMDSQEADRLRSQTTPSSESLPTMEQFTNELTGVGMARMGIYNYNVARVNSSARWGYNVVEFIRTDIHNPIRIRFIEELTGNRPEITVYRMEAFNVAIEWATERRNEQLPHPQPNIPQEDLDVPVRDEELTPEAREILELLGKNKKWYKTAQAHELLPTMEQFTFNITRSSTGSMGIYKYKIIPASTLGSRGSMFHVIEYKTSYSSPTRQQMHLNFSDAIKLVTSWATERRNEQFSRPSESSTNINAFARELFEFGKVYVGSYRYTVTRVEGVYEVAEYKSQYGTGASKVERFIQRESAIGKAVDWVMEALDQQSSGIHEKDIPVRDEEIPPENRDILELLGKNKNVIKTAQATQRYEIRNRFTNDVIYSATTTSLRACVEEAVRRVVNLSGADLSGANLFGADLSGADLFGADLFEANLSGADLFEANLFEADLSRADLSGAYLSEADLYRADLTRANLSGATNVNLEGALHTNTIIREERPAKKEKNKPKEPEKPKPPEDVPVKDEEIPPENREILELLGKNKKIIKTSQATQLFEIRHRNTHEVIYSSTTTSLSACVEQAVRSGVSLSGANLYWANLSGSDLSGANLSYAYLHIADLSNANLSYTNLSGADLSGADLFGADLFGADLFEANLSVLTNVNLEGALNTETIIREERPAKKEKNKSKEPEKPKPPEDVPVKDEEIPPENREVLELLGKQKEIINRMSFKSNEDWYLNLAESIGDELKGYFKFIVRTNDGPIGIYNIWWEGLDKNIKITKHDMPIEEFSEYKNDIIKTAKEESLKAYKEVMLSQGK